MSGWDDWPLEPPPPAEPDSDSFDIAEVLRNVTLEDTHYPDSEEKDDDGDGHTDAHADTDAHAGIREYPVRPYAEDCSFYMRTGTCKFKLSCRFNHPVWRGNQVPREKKENEGPPEQTATIDCKYFLTPGGCKFGEACRYRHSEEHNETTVPELNFLGLPKRLGERECPFYMRHGSCGYGAKCRFHHPEPTGVQSSDPASFAPVNESSSSNSWENQISESDPLQVLGLSQPGAASWSSSMMSNDVVSFLDDPGWNGFQNSISPEASTRQTTVNPQGSTLQTSLPSLVNSSLQSINGSIHHPQPIQVEEFPERPGQPECDYFMKTGDCKYRSACRYHHPKNRVSVNAFTDKGPLSKAVYAQEKTRQIYPAVAVNDLMNIAGFSAYGQLQLQMEDFPERPGQPECSYYMKTGDCKYRSTCRFHHPKDRVSMLSICSLSDKGLPLRPGQKICWHYKQYGICKFGRSCVFDHSEGEVSSDSHVGSLPVVPSVSDPETPGQTIM